MKINTAGLTQTGYRAITAMNASSIKLFEKDRSRFYKEVVLGEKSVNKESDSIILGNIVDFCLSDCNGNWELFESRMNEKFFLMPVKRGSGQMFDLADELYRLTLQRTDEDGNVVMDNFTDLLNEAFVTIQSQDKFKGKNFEWLVGKWEEEDASKYYDALINNIGKTVIDEWMLEKGKKVVENVIYDEFIQPLFLERNDIENLGKFVIVTEYNGFTCKCEIDKLQIDHKTKKVIITEIKTNWDIEEGFEYTILKLRYDIAAIFYKNCVMQWIGTERKDLLTYIIDFQFLTVDTSNKNLRPLIRPFGGIDMQNAYYGFKVRGYRYKGLFELMEEIKWCNKNQIWNISKEAYESKGVVPLNINYDKN